MKKQITETDGIHKQWYKDAKKQTLETLPQFLNDLMNNYSHDYGTICRALSAGSIATAWAMNAHKNGNITGFQAGAVMWGFVREWNYETNELGLEIIDYDNMLYPQYDYKFKSKTISKNQWVKMQKRAAKLLKESPQASEGVKNHWISISEGFIPFGYTVSKD